MKILLTGACGRLGSSTLKYLLQRHHTIIATDRIAITKPSLDSLADLEPSQSEGYTYYLCDLNDFEAFQKILEDTQPEAIIHLGAIPDPMSLDPRVVHNNNVAGSYNVMQTAAALGIKRIVQASSVNATGLSYTPEGHHRFHELPVTEKHPVLPEDPYAISKAVCELQAAALTRYYPDLRIASLRFHMVKPTYEEAVPLSRVRDGFAWVSNEASASACLRAVLSDGWTGHEVFNITAPEIAWEGGRSDGHEEAPHLKADVGTLELFETFWKGRLGTINKEYFEGRPRRTPFDSTKAEWLLGWDHDKAAEMDL